MGTEIPTDKDSIFSQGDDWWNNACVNFAFDELRFYTYGYKEAADTLVNSIVKTGIKNDILLNPIAFCYRHYLELAFKTIIIKCSQLLDIPSTEPTGHNIQKLWGNCLPLLSKVFHERGAESYPEITRLIAEYSSVDRYATAFRYPKDKIGNPSLPGMKTFNICNLGDVIGKIDNILYGILEELSLYQSYKDEMSQ